MNSLDSLVQQRIVRVDGGMGTLLQALGLQGGQQPETWNMLFSDRVQQIHESYLNAGCDIVTANTFGANALTFRGDTDVIVKTGVKLAKDACLRVGRGLVAMDLGPTGKLLKPYGDLAFEDAVSLFRQGARAGAQAGADLIIIETMADSYELKAAVLGAREACTLPICATMMINENGKLLTGGDIPGMVSMLEGLGVYALGLNCGLGPIQMKPLVETILKYASVPVWVSPNAGLPEVIDGQTCFNVGPAEFAKEMADLGRMGVRIMGGCCGTTPDHIKAMTEAVKDIAPVPVTKKHHTILSSHSRTVIINDAPVIIGERINPTGKKKFKEALRQGDLDYILREAVTQQENGAHILDVNVGLPEIDEADWMERAVAGIQGVSSLPLQLDTTNIDALERGLRVYNGKPLINSISGKQEVMDAVFPLMQKYGGAVVALLLDEGGIPETAQGRVDIGKKIIAEAAKYGISPKDILMDGLVMTVSTGAEAAKVTLETVRRVKEELNVHTVLGVSNVSFGLPQREKINGAFLSMALHAGLDGAIINPGAEAMVSAFRSSLALLGKDIQFESYLGAYGGTSPIAPVPTLNRALDPAQAVLRGLAGPAREGVAALLDSGSDPMEIIEQLLIPALDEVGKGFETGNIYLPQLLMSAEAAKGAFGLLQERMAAAGHKTQSKGKVILATVQGDIHDIGKNIVKVLLQNYAFDVIDLGKDVPPEAVLEAAQKEDVTLIGLSALMTTTVPSMEKTIRLLRKEKPNCKIMVGGAVLTQEYADHMGADFYGKDAMASVHYCQEVSGKDAIK